MNNKDFYLISKSEGVDKTASGVQRQYTEFEGYHNQGGLFSGVFIHSASFSWRDMQVNGTSSDGWRKDYDVVQRSQTIVDDVPYLNKFHIDRCTTYGQQDSIKSLAQYGISINDLIALVFD